MCVCCIFLDFKRLLACTLNLVIGHLVPTKCRNWGDVPKKFPALLRPPKSDLVATPLPVVRHTEDSATLISDQQRQRLVSCRKRMKCDTAALAH